MFYAGGRLALLSMFVGLMDGGSPWSLVVLRWDEEEVDLEMRVVTVIDLSGFT